LPLGKAADVPPDINDEAWNWHRNWNRHWKRSGFFHGRPCNTKNVGLPVMALIQFYLCTVKQKSNEVIVIRV
jgi:hypothetical protein